MSAPLHPDETARLEAIRRDLVGSLHDDPALVDLARYASDVCGTPVSLVSVVEETRQRFLAKVGFDRDETTRDESFCAHAILGEGVFEVPDASRDARFRDNLLVRDDGFRFYAGVPVHTADGLPVGALCVVDRVPRELDGFQRRTLEMLARQVEARLELARAARDLERGRQQADRESERNADFLRLVTDRLPVRVAYVDREFRFRFMNDAYEREVGLRRQDALGRTIAEATNEPTFEAVRDNLERALRGERHVQELPIPYPSGVRVVQVAYVPDPGPDGVARGVVVQALDVTERRGVEDALRESDAHYRTLFNSIDEGFCTFEMLFDADGRPVDYRFLEVNDAFVDQTGLAREAAVGATIRELVPTHEQHWFDLYGRVALTGESLRFEDRAEGLGRWYEVHAFRIGGEGSREVGAIFKDVSDRHEAERALADERRRLDETLETAGVATFDWDVEKDRLRGNALLRLFYGLPDEPEGSPIARFYAAMHPDDRHARAQAIEGALADGKRYEAEYRVTDDGRERWVLARGDVTTDADGKPLRVTGVVLDVSERVRADAARREREELFRTVFEQAPDDAILVMDLDRTLTAWNPAAERITGWSAAEAIGNPADFIFTPEDRETGGPAQETEGAALRGKAEDERWHMRKDGSRFWGSGTMNALHDAKGNVTGFLKVFRDATARHEEARRLDFLRRLAESMADERDPDAIVLAAERMLGEHLAVNRSLYAEFSAEEDAFRVRRDWTSGVDSLVGEHRLGVFGSRIAANVRGGRTDVMRDREREPDLADGLAALRTGECAAAITVPVRQEGRTVGIYAVNVREPRDWTDAEIALVQQVADRVNAEVERARAEQALREANRTLESRVEARTAELQRTVQEAEGFNYSISHDLRTPLRAVVATSGILLEELGPDLDEAHRALLERQGHNANRMGRLIDELLRLSRFARVEVKRERLDMTAKVRSVFDDLVEQGRTNGCRLDAQDGMRAEGDRDLLRTVLHNLLGNACKFSPEGGTIRVRQEGPVFSVADEGVGFDMAFAAKVFVPFERLVTDAEFEGTGIGLANVRRIVERHGGKVWVESAPGRGTTFSFTLE